MSKYKIGTKVKINTKTLDRVGWLVMSCVNSYPDATFTVESYRIEKDYGYGLQGEGCKETIYYTIVTDPKSLGDTYRFEVREYNLISIQELRDRKINEILY